MKSLILVLLLTTSAWAQTVTDTPKTEGNTVKTEFPALSWNRIKQNLKIRYFSEILGPTIKKWDDNEYDAEGQKMREPMRMFHSFNIRYFLNSHFALFMSPRFITVIGDRNDIRPTDDDNVMQIDDWQIGVAKLFYKGPTFQYQQRFTHRQPFSLYSKNSGIDSQIEWTHDFTWQQTSAIRWIHWNNYRYYVYNGATNSERYRINFTNLFNYDFNDYWRVQVMHEHDLQHRGPERGPKRKEWNYFERNENHFSFGVGYSPVRDLSFIPFIRVWDDRNIRNETTIVGLWVLGRVL